MVLQRNSRIWSKPFGQSISRSYKNNILRMYSSFGSQTIDRDGGVTHQRYSFAIVCVFAAFMTNVFNA